MCLLYDQVLLTRGSQVHVCCKLVTCDSAFPYIHPLVTVKLSMMTQLVILTFSMILTPNPMVTLARVVLSAMLQFLETQQLDNCALSPRTVLG